MPTPTETKIAWLRGEIARMRANVRLFHNDRARRAECARLWLKYRRTLRFYLHQQEIEREHARLAEHARLGRAKSDELTALRRAWWAGHVTTTEYRTRWAVLALRAVAV